MLKNRRSFLLLILIPALLSAAPGCSFRKEKLKDNNGAITEEKTVSTKELLATGSSPEKLKSLDKLTDSELSTGQYLDLAITNKDQNLLIYLLNERGVSPFSYSTESAELLANDPIRRSIVESYQNPALDRLLSVTLKNNTTKTWDQELIKLNIHSGSCVNIFDKVLSNYFYVVSSIVVNEVNRLTQTSVIDTYKSLSTTRTCSNMKAQVSAVQLTNWYQLELKKQFYANFESSKLIELFGTLGTIQDLSIDVADKRGEVRIDPRVLVFTALPFAKQIAKKKQWLTILDPLVNRSSSFYRLPYVSADFVGYKCWNDDPLCERDMGNLVSAGTTLSLLTHTSADYEDPAYRPDAGDYLMEKTEEGQGAE